MLELQIINGGIILLIAAVTGMVVYITNYYDKE